MKTDFNSFVVFFLVTIFPISLHARTYQVEVLVFSNKNSIAFEEEFFSELESLPSFPINNPLKRPPDGLEEMGPNIFPVPYQVLANEQKKLNLESKFETNPDLKIIFSEGWNHGRPEGNEFEYVYLESEPIRIFSIENKLNFRDTAKLSKAFTSPTIAILQGLVGIRVSQLLYVDLDFVFGSVNGLVRMKESRKIKLNELNYFDHPLFGVLLMVSPVDQASDGD